MALDQVDVDTLDEKEGNEMSFLDHLEALRWHILRSVLAILFFAIIIFIAKDFVFRNIIFGPRYKDFLTYRILCSISDSMCIDPPQFIIATREVGEAFMMHMMVSFWMGFVLAIPILLWEVWKFIKPGLYPKEQKAASGFVIISTLLFIAGVLFGYYVVAPLAITFLAGYTIEGVAAQPTLSSYVDSMVMFTLPIGLVFELPVIVYFLAKIGLLTADFMKKYRKHAVVVLLIIAAVVTPSPDIASQLLVFIPLYALYEASIFVAKKVQRELEAEEALAEQELIENEKRMKLNQ
ncbi:MAG: twin-arginine translocase subunit TatC [Saprospiraceae bacterium]|nr:twin-arginine translocase subunit TatC [Saprospiraceae bacterium]